MRGMIGNLPIRVVASPSRRLTRRPFQPTRAVYGPDAGSQQSPTRFHVRSVAAVVRSRRALTVISCGVAGGGCVAPLCAWSGGQEAASAAATTGTAGVIVAQSTLRRMGLVAVV